jgi:copper chaperone CopZ
MSDFWTLKLLKMDKQIMAFRLILATVMLTAISCSGNPDRKAKSDVQKEASVIEVSIGGMFCTDCELTIQKRVGELAGIKSVKASYTAGNATIQYFPDKIDSAKIRQAITGSGYSVKKFIVPSN